MYAVNNRINSIWLIDKKNKMEWKKLNFDSVKMENKKIVRANIFNIQKIYFKLIYKKNNSFNK